MNRHHLVLGTRGSLLARTQSGHVRDALLAADRTLAVELEIVKTEGDRLQEAPPAPGEKLQKGLFTSALEEALLAGRIDLAVHSMKDLPTALPQGLEIAAVPRRADARDAFLSNGPRFADLGHGARVGTGSRRRALQLQLLRPDLAIVPVRGNVDTRIRQLRSGELDGLVLAAAGLARIGREAEVVEYFELEQMLPAPAQGALAIEMRAGPDAERVRRLLDDAGARAAATAERAVLAAIGGGCELPLGAHARAVGGELHLRAVLFSADGRARAAAERTGAAHDAEQLGAEVARALTAALGGGPP